MPENMRRSRPSGHWAVCRRPGDGRQVVAGSPFVARVADGFRFGFVRFPSRGFGPLMFAYPVQLPHQHAWLSACILARALGAFFIGATETLPNRAGPRSLGNRATGQLMP